MDLIIGHFLTPLNSSTTPGASEPA